MILDHLTLPLDGYSKKTPRTVDLNPFILQRKSRHREIVLAKVTQLVSDTAPKDHCARPQLKMLLVCWAESYTLTRGQSQFGISENVLFYIPANLSYNVRIYV